MNLNLGGLNSGFMMSHVTASALVSENKVLCHPSSTDSLTTSAGTEDHVSMGGWAARKALQVVKNVENVLGLGSKTDQLFTTYFPSPWTTTNCFF